MDKNLLPTDPTELQAIAREVGKRIRAEMAAAAVEMGKCFYVDRMALLIGLIRQDRANKPAK